MLGLPIYWAASP